eukprot:9502538-Pyramimonas_sp.AAC.1
MPLCSFRARARMFCSQGGPRCSSTGLAQKDARVRAVPSGGAARGHMPEGASLPQAGRAAGPP